MVHQPVALITANRERLFSGIGAVVLAGATNWALRRISVQAPTPIVKGRAVTTPSPAQCKKAAEVPL